MPRPWRRVLTLTAALALVLWAMGEARKPENYGWLWALEEERTAQGAGPAAPEQQPPDEPEPPDEPFPEPKRVEPSEPGKDTLPGLGAEGPRGPITGPRDLLERFGIDQSRFERFVDGRPLHTDEEETLLRLLFRTPEFNLEDVERWARAKLDPGALAADPGPRRGEVYRLSGRVTAMEVCTPVPEAAQRYEMPRYYRCDFVLDGSDQPAVVYARTVPRAWLAKAPKNERAGALGFFLKTGSGDPQGPLPVFAARRVAWYPAGTLGDLGMDAGLFDDVADRQTLLPEERETFYQLLAAVKRAKPGQVLREAEAGGPGAGSDGVVPLFREPAAQRGRLVALSGVARKVVRVLVPDPDIGSRFGIDHYYEISLFTPDSQGNPLIFCVPELPEGMPVGENPDFQEQVRLAGVFLKTWTYRVPPPPDAPPEKRNDMTVWKKQAPLLIGAAPVWYPWAEPERNDAAAIVAGVLFVVAALGIGLALWRTNRGDKEFRRRVFPGPGGPGPPDAAPDFNALDAGPGPGEARNDP